MQRASAGSPLGVTPASGTDRLPETPAAGDAAGPRPEVLPEGGPPPAKSWRGAGRFRLAALPALPAWLAWVSGFVAAGLVLFYFYLRLSRTASVSSDGASNALQAWDLLHGNPLLRGWTLSDVSFYTTELPQYAAVELVRGLNSDVIHVSAAITYTLLVLLAALLAKGRATGREAWVRMLIAAGIMLAPQLGQGTPILLLQPDHVGTEVPLLLIWLVLDRAPRRWYVPVAVGLILAVVEVGDRIALTVAVLPLVAVCGVRAYRAIFQRSEPPLSQWFEVSLAVAALLSFEVARVTEHTIAGHGGFVVQPLKSSFASIGDMPAHFWLTIQGILGLYGANFFGEFIGVDAGFTVLHLIGMAVAVWAVCRAVRHFFGQDLVVQVLAAAIVINVLSYTFSVLPGTYWGTRQIAAVLPLGAVLAGRLLAGRMIQAKLVPAMAAALFCYVFALGHGITQPPVPAYGQNLAGFLSAHHLTYGLADYAEANSTTLASGGHVQVREPSWPAGFAFPGNYESKASWYDPHLHYANFVVAVREPHGHKSVLYYDALRDFGRPVNTYRISKFIVMTWDKNLLTTISANVAAHPQLLVNPNQPVQPAPSRGPGQRP